MDSGASVQVNISIDGSRIVLELGLDDSCLLALDMELKRQI